MEIASLAIYLVVFVNQHQHLVVPSYNVESNQVALSRSLTVPTDSHVVVTERQWANREYTDWGDTTVVDVSNFTDTEVCKLLAAYLLQGKTLKVLLPHRAELNLKIQGFCSNIIQVLVPPSQVEKDHLLYFPIIHQTEEEHLDPSVVVYSAKLPPEYHPYNFDLPKFVNGEFLQKIQLGKLSKKSSILLCPSGVYYYYYDQHLYAFLLPPEPDQLLRKWHVHPTLKEVSIRDWNILTHKGNRYHPLAGYGIKQSITELASVMSEKKEGELERLINCCYRDSVQLLQLVGG